MKKRLIVATVLFVLAVIGFAYAGQTTICVLFDDGVTGALSARQAKAQSNIADYMDNDLVRVFGRYAKAGYEAKLIEKRQDFTPQSGNYLLTVKIVDYNPGSKAARMIVGYGAGGVSLKIHYELFADGKNAILTKDDGVFSGIEWTRAARKLNENMAKAVAEKLGSR
jgi:hypothetical protein